MGIVLIAGGAFFGGMKYSQSGSQRENFQRMQMGQNPGAFGAGLGRGGRTAGPRVGNFVAGKVLSKDDTSITIELPEGGSRIIFFSQSTEITSSVKGTTQDVVIGKNLMINGTQNADGSVTAQTIQIRPAPANQNE